MSNTRVLILPHTCDQYHERQQGCRDSWLKDFPKYPQLNYLFVLAGSSMGIHVRDDCVRLACQEQYALLPAKTRAMCEWALRHQNWDYLFKCDDDTYIHLPRFVELANEIGKAGHHYVGNEAHNPPQGYASGGAGYFLSRFAAEVVARDLLSPTGPEDLLVGRTLARKQVSLQVCPRLVPYGKDGPWPDPGNLIVTSHYLTPNIMRRVYAALNGAVIPPPSLSP